MTCTKGNLSHLGEVVNSCKRAIPQFVQQTRNLPPVAPGGRYICPQCSSMLCGTGAELFCPVCLANLPASGLPPYQWVELGKSFYSSDIRRRYKQILESVQEIQSNLTKDAGWNKDQTEASRPKWQT